MLEFGEIEDGRRRSRISKRELSLRAGIDPHTYGRLLSNAQSPTVRTLSKLSLALKMLVAESAIPGSDRIGSPTDGDAA